MKLLGFALLSIFYCTCCFGQKQHSKVVVAYVTSGTEVMPDPKYITHINYAFGHVNNTFNGVVVENPARLAAIAALKSKNKNLKVLLSIGGWGSGGFSEMAANEYNRNRFADSCAVLIQQYNLDGIDVDWEYPTSKVAGITATKDDTYNYTLLMRAIRKVIGPRKLLTLASVDNARFVDFKAITSIVDFVNIMLYETDAPPKHQAALYRSALASYITCEESVNAHLMAGLKPHQIVLGLPFYGTGNGVEVKQTVLYRDLVKIPGLEKKWDDTAKAPYLANKKGALVCSYDSPESIAFKCAFIKQKTLRGAMYWQYAGDTNDGVLRKAVYKGLIQ